MIMKKLIIFILIPAVLIGGFFYFRYQVFYSHNNSKENKIFEIQKGQGNGEVSQGLLEENLISGKWYFYYYMKTRNLLDKIMPGKYELNGGMTIPEIASLITSQKEEYIKITFPEGWTAKKMAERLSENGLDGEEFLKIVQNPEEIKQKYAIINDKNIKTLEGFLFPDTYFFKPETTAENIVSKMLDNFTNKITPEIQNAIKGQNKNLYEIITMASIIEKEVNSSEDRKIVSGIFWSRIKIGQALQSCATLAFVLGENKKQYSFADTRVNSPYNTYINKGLTPGPISNPGISSITAAVYPQDSNYNYFLSDPETGKTIFSKTLEEHNTNKDKYGL